MVYSMTLSSISAMTIQSAAYLLTYLSNLLSNALRRLCIPFLYHLRGVVILSQRFKLLLGFFDFVKREAYQGIYSLVDGCDVRTHAERAVQDMRNFMQRITSGFP